MHIPDGYLSPQTYIPFYGIILVVWNYALRKIKRILSVKMVPYVAMASAFSFLIMMFNVPIPGGTSGHAVGTAVIALILGPEVAVISVSIALIIQALVFGDGGITAIGANCFNIAFAMSYVSWYVFKMFKVDNPESQKAYIAAFLAGYISLTVAAFLTGVEFGIQPLIASEGGKPLYAPYPLSVAVSAMLIEHLAIFSIIEGIVTAGILRYFIKNNRELISVFKKGDK